MSFGNISGCSSIHNYEHAHNHFTRTPGPRRKSWYPTQRPLDNVYKHHYRLEQGPGAEYYDVCLYRTVMARYYRPQADGGRRVQYTYHDSVLSKGFMRRVVNSSPVMKMRAALPDGTTPEVLVPVSYRELETDLWFDVNGRLLTQHSHHAPMYKYVSGAGLREWRKKLRENTQTLATLLECAMPEEDDLPVNNHLSWGRSVAFEGVRSYMPFDISQQLRKFTGEVQEGGVAPLRALWIACLALLVARRREQAEPAPKYSWRRAKKEVPFVYPTAQEVTRSWRNQLEKFACGVPRREKVQIPDWPTKLVKAFVF